MREETWTSDFEVWSAADSAVPVVDIGQPQQETGLIIHYSSTVLCRGERDKKLI